MVIFQYKCKVSDTPQFALTFNNNKHDKTAIDLKNVQSKPWSVYVIWKALFCSIQSKI